MSKDGIYVCADLGVNWMGDYGVLDLMMHDAAAAGVDAVKLQLFDREYLAQADYGDSLRERLSQMCIPMDLVEYLWGSAHDKGLELVVTPFTKDIAMSIPKSVDGIKIRAKDCFRTDLVGIAHHYDLPLYISVPTTDGYLKKPEAVPEADFFSLMAHAFSGKGHLVMCPPGYPQRLQDLHLHRAMDFQGFSFHGKSHYIPLMAATVAANAVQEGRKAKRRFYLEVHAVPDHGRDDNWMYPDGDVSLSWRHVNNLVAGVKALEEAI